MEKIQLALERARREREATLGAQNGMAVESAPAGGAVPLVPAVRRALARHRVVASGACGDVAMPIEAFGMLRVQVLQRLATMGGRSLAVTSPRAGEGKSFVAVNLAFSIARHVEQGAILVDADLRRPAVHEHLGITPAHDIVDLLEGRASLDDCLIRPAADNFLALLGRSSSPRSSEILAQSRAAQLFAELKRRFPSYVIIVDCPPLLSTEDPQIIQTYVDGCLLVVREGETTKTDLRRAADLVGENRYLGSVLNDARWAASSAYRY